ncbi:MAG: glycosyltransferase family 4 protein [Terrimicrobiaceae bacterium]
MNQLHACGRNEINHCPTGPARKNPDDLLISPPARFGGLFIPVISKQRFKVHAPSTSWICSQIGAREHYAIPRVLHRSGRLEALFTDYWSHGLWHTLGRTARAHRLTSRTHEELTDAEVYSFNTSAILDGLRQRLRRPVDPYAEFLRIGHRFGRQVRSSLARRRDQRWENTIFFGYDTGFLEAAAWAKDRGAACVVCQMDPAQVEIEMVQEEEKRWPAWSKARLLVPERYSAWRKAEWALADAVMVNSQWTLEALVRQGVPAGKIHIVPLAYEAADLAGPPSPIPLKPEAEPLRVLFLGQVNLRKGVPYLLEAAKLLRGENIQMDIVGPISISDQCVVTAASNVRFHGPVTRDRVREFYTRADVFVLPTISDGFALTQLEAMAHGLPVITTPNCGRVVTDGVDGFLIPPRDPAALARAIHVLAEDPERLQAMREAARQALARFRLDQLDSNLRTLESKLKGTTPATL